MRVEQIRAFLEQPEIQLLVEDENLEEVYNKCDRRGRKDLTEYLLSLGVQPDAYMDHLPEAFLRASLIRSYDISSTVSVIGNYAFFECKSLASITIPNSVKSIGHYSFHNCDSLTSIKIPDSVTSIGENAFYHCDSLTSVTLPNSVTSIGSDAFTYCGDIEIYYSGTKEQWKETVRVTAFRYTSCVVHCADGDIIVD